MRVGRGDVYGDGSVCVCVFVYVCLRVGWVCGGGVEGGEKEGGGGGGFT